MTEEAESVDGGMWKKNLEEWIYEETKIVTYKWLSKQISVHVNVAKQMLFEFAQQQLKDETKSDLEVIYLLAGRIVKEPKSTKVCLVKSKNLQAKEVEFEFLTSKHVYAVSKAEKSLLTETNACQVIWSKIWYSEMFL